MLNTPVSLITFNRPDHTRQTLQRILEAHPRDLYIIQNNGFMRNVNDVILYLLNYLMGMSLFFSQVQYFVRQIKEFV